jgi:hypothetical protein
MFWRRKITQAGLGLFVGAVSVYGQTNPPAQQPSVTYNTDFFRKVTHGSVFIYDTQHDACTPPPPNLTLAPMGSGFVTGIEKKGGLTPQGYSGWRFLITAKHVVKNRTEIQIRVNSENESKLVCKMLKLEMQGKEQNVIMAPDGVDLVAIVLPHLEDAYPTVVASTLLIDEAKMKELNIGIGTEVLTIGYLYSYSGREKNFPVAQFGHISLMTDEVWYHNDSSGLMEQGYGLDLSNAPGLSGAPVFSHGIEFETNPVRFRQLSPYLIGVVKAMMLAPANGQWISQGIAVIEPGVNLKALMQQIATMLKAQGADIADIQ